MPEFVRVKSADNGSEFTVNRDHAEAHDLQILADKPATDSWGNPLPPKYPVRKTARQTAAADTKEKS